MIKNLELIHEPKAQEVLADWYEGTDAKVLHVWPDDCTSMHVVISVSEPEPPDCLQFVRLFSLFTGQPWNISIDGESREVEAYEANRR